MIVTGSPAAGITLSAHDRHAIVTIGFTRVVYDRHARFRVSEGPGPGMLRAGPGRDPDSAALY